MVTGHRLGQRIVVIIIRILLRVLPGKVRQCQAIKKALCGALTESSGHASLPVRLVSEM